MRQAIERFWEWKINQVDEFIKNTKSIWGDESITLPTKQQMVSNGIKQVMEGMWNTLAECDECNQFDINMFRIECERAYLGGLFITGMKDYLVDPTYSILDR